MDQIERHHLMKIVQIQAIQHLNPIKTIDQRTFVNMKRLRSLCKMEF